VRSDHFLLICIGGRSSYERWWQFSVYFGSSL